MKYLRIIGVLSMSFLALLLPSSAKKDIDISMVDNPPAPTRKVIAKYKPNIAESTTAKGNTPPTRKVPSRGKEMEKPSYSKEDLYWLSRIVSAEAKGESVEGQIAVANIILNRVKDEQFPNTVKDVIFAKGQFSPVSNGSIYYDPTPQAIESSKEALLGVKVIKDEDVVYFYNPDKSAKDSWIRTRKTYVRIGNHTFCYK